MQLLWVTRVLLVPYGMGLAAMDAGRLYEVYEVLMARPRTLVGSAEIVCVAYAATPEERRAALISGISPLWE